MDNQRTNAALDVPVYKYLSSQFTDKLAGGSFRIGNARLYRLLEVATGDRNIGDRDEASGETVLERMEVGNGDIPAEEERKRADAAKIGMVISEGVKDVLITDFIDRTHIPCFLFCASRSQTHLSPDSKSTTFLSPEYNSVVRFPSLVHVAQSLYAYGTVHGHPQVEGKSVRDVFDVTTGFVTYSNQAYAEKYLTGFRVDVLNKKPFYEYQNEARIVFIPRPEYTGLRIDYLTIECPQAGANTNVSIFASSPENTSTPQQHLDHLAALVRIHLYCRMAGQRHSGATDLILQRPPASLEDKLELRRASADRDLRRSRQEKAAIKKIFGPLASHYWSLRTHFGGSDMMDDELESGPLSFWFIEMALAEYISKLVSSNVFSAQDLAGIEEQIRKLFAPSLDSLLAAIESQQG
ncbi:hypothetical protein [Hyphomonas chukchiensis]|nr:hypothetical protein [Hyphomonas chukchiensis]